MKQVLQLSGLA